MLNCYVTSNVLYDNESWAISSQIKNRRGSTEGCWECHGRKTRDQQRSFKEIRNEHDISILNPKEIEISITRIEERGFRE